LPIIPPILAHSSLSIIIGDRYNRPVVASVIVDSVPHHPKKGGKKYELHGAITEKMSTFITTVPRTSNPTKRVLFSV
jgi:hypothetical protein